MTIKSTLIAGLSAATIGLATLATPAVRPGRMSAAVAVATGLAAAAIALAAAAVASAAARWDTTSPAAPVGGPGTAVGTAGTAAIATAAAGAAAVGAWGSARGSRPARWRLAPMDYPYYGYDYSGYDDGDGCYAYRPIYDSWGNYIGRRLVNICY